MQAAAEAEAALGAARSEAEAKEAALAAKAAEQEAAARAAQAEVQNCACCAATAVDQGMCDPVSQRYGSMRDCSSHGLRTAPCTRISTMAGPSDT